MTAFLARCGTLVRFILAGFDRLRLRGEPQQLNNARGVDSYLYRQHVRHVEFPTHAEALTATLRTGTAQYARAAGVPLQHLDSPSADKDAAARALAQQHGRTTGPLAIVTAVEGCTTYQLRKDAAGWVKPAKGFGKCLHYYHYFNHDELGWCYVRVQSWFPFSIRVGLNGRRWLYRQLERRGVAFEHRDNLLTACADLPLAQELLAAQCRTDWPTLLTALVEPLQPLWSYLHAEANCPYYWVAEQSEWATDLLFHDPAELARWYPRWLRHGRETLQCADVLRYFGKQRPAHCQGEVKIDERTRPAGTRLKFWHNSNALKLYDKEGLALRVETTINQPRDFRVYRTAQGAAADAPPAWRPLRKGVADLPRRAEVGQAANQRVLESLASVAAAETLEELLRPLGRPVVQDGRRRARALNPLTGADGTLLRTLGNGAWLINGFRNRDLRQALHGSAADPATQRRQAAAVTRHLALLKAHGVIVKVAQTHRYHLSAAGRRIVTALAAAAASDVARLMAAS